MISVQHFLKAETKFIINEIGSNYQENSFLELLAPNGIDTASDMNYGLTVLKVDLDEPEVVKIKAVFEIPKVEFEQEKFYFTIGSPRGDWLTEYISFKGLSLRSGLDTRRIYGQAYTWLDVLDNCYKIIIVTESKTPISKEWPGVEIFHRGRRNEQDLKRHPKFKSYIIQNQIDVAVLRHIGVEMSSDIIDSLLLLDMEPKYIIPPPHDFLELAKGEAKQLYEISLSRCQEEIGNENILPFQHSLFKGCPVSPGAPNLCENQVVFIQNIDSIPMETSDEQESELETNEVEGDVLMEENDNEVEQEILHEETDMVNENDVPVVTIQQPYNPSCSIEEDYSPDDNAAEILEQLATRAEEVAVENPSHGDVNRIAFAEKEQKDRVVVDMAKMKEFMPNTVNENLVVTKYWKWYNQQFDEVEHSNSKFNCGPCSTHIGEDATRNKLANPDGVTFNTNKKVNMNLMARHHKSFFHERAMLAEDIEKALLLDPDLAKTLVQKDIEENKVTLNHIQQVYYSARKYDSFDGYDASIDNLIAMGVPMGDGCRGAHSAKKIALIMNEIFKEEFIEMLRRTSGPIFLIVDGSEGT